jgi:hypothetical protein
MIVPCKVRRGKHFAARTPKIQKAFGKSAEMLHNLSVPRSSVLPLARWGGIRAHPRTVADMAAEEKMTMV